MLIKELQALALDIRVLDENRNEIEIRELEDDDEDMSDALPVGREPLADDDYDKEGPSLTDGEDIDLDDDISLDDDFGDFEVDDTLDDLKLDDDDDIE